MNPKKLDPQDAFDLVTRREGKEMLPPAGVEDIESGFGQGKAGTRPWWFRLLMVTMLLLVAAVIVSGIGAFYWFVTQESEPAVVIKPPPEKPPELISEDQAKKIIEENLRAFLAAENNAARERYVFPDGSTEARNVFYNERRIRDVPFWKIESMEKTVSQEGEIWFVVFRDLQRHFRSVTFQRYGDDYRLHWLAMKAFCDIPWEAFIVEQPTKPAVMRGYLRPYRGEWPVGVSPQHYHCFLISDKKGLFSELAVMKRDADGAGVLSGLPDLPQLSTSKGHPVTLELGYFQEENSPKKRLQIHALRHLRWQRTTADERFLKD